MIYIEENVFYIDKTFNSQVILKAKLCQFMQRYAKLMQENSILKEGKIAEE